MWLISAVLVMSLAIVGMVIMTFANNVASQREARKIFNILVNVKHTHNTLHIS